MSDDTLNTTAQMKLRSVVDRIERLEADKASIAEDLKEVYAEAKSDGFDTKIIRKVIKLRKQDTATRQEEQALVDLYMHAVQGDLFEDTKVTITASGFKAETTVGAMRRAAGRA